MMHFTSVLLPAPFSPSSAWNEPGRTLSSTLSSAVKSPNRMVIAIGVDAERATGKRCFADDHDSAPISAVERRDRAEHAALHLDHFQRVVVVALVGRGTAILDQHAFEAAVVGFAHGGMDADVGGDPGQHDVLDAAQPQHQFEVGGAERSLAGLVDDGLTRQRRQIRNDLPAGLAAHQHAAARAGIADPGADLARTPLLVGGQVGEVGAVSFAGVDDVKALRAHRREQLLDRLDRRAGQRKVIAHLVDIAADAAEVGLHVDDDQRGIFRTQIAIIGPRIGFGFDVALGHGSLSLGHVIG